MKVIIVGGVAGGATTATRLRRLNEKAEIILIERGKHISFANCGLPYYIGEEIKKEKDLLLQTPESFKARHNVDVRIMHEVIKVDKENKQVEIKDIENQTTYQESYDILVLSPGAEPIKPNIPIEDKEKVFTLRTIGDTVKIKEYIHKNKPKHITIMGGGYIGLEMLDNLYKLGIEVTLIEKQDHILGPIDTDMATYLYHYIQGKGAKIKLNSEVKEIRKDKNRLNVITNKEEIQTDMVISSIGVRPESKLAKEAGLALNARGSIVVDETMKTSDENIYALGDAVAMKHYVTGKETFIPLAGPANKQARVVANNIMGRKTTYKGTQGSSVLKIVNLTVASTGITEAVAKQEGLDYDKIYLTPYSHATYYPGAHSLTIKIIYEKETGRILGGQFIGKEGVDKRCDVLATCIRHHLTAEDLSELELCYAPPYSSAKDPLNIAGNMIENALDGSVKNIAIEGIEEEKVTIIDVREEYEVKEGKIPNSIHIRLDKLRNYLENSKLDKQKSVVVYCRTGLRSYAACRILQAKGYDAYNLSGGYQLYHMLNQEK